MFLCQRVGKIQALLVFCFGFACRQKPNVLECAVGIILLSFTLFTVVVFLALAVTGSVALVADCGRHPCQPLQNFERSRRVQAATAPDIGYIACYAQFYSINSLSIFVFIKLSLGRS
jgi:hypothetical protein